MRHARAEEPSGSDYERALSGRGVEEAGSIGEILARRAVVPDLALSSPAPRAAETARLVLAHANAGANVRYDARIYEATAGRLLQIISEIDTDAREVLLVGHNPGVASLLTSLTGETRHIGTATLARILFDCATWGEASEQGGRLSWVVSPGETA